MKKLFALLLALCMVLSLAACASEPAANDPATTEPGATQPAASDPAASFDVESTKEWNKDAPTGFKIGFAYLPPSDTLSTAFHKALDYSAQEFGCEMFYIEWAAFGADSILAGYENMVQAGCDAMIPIMAMAPVVELCNKNEVYFLPACCEVDETLLPMCLESDYYLGNIHEDEIISGYKLAENLYNAGCRNVIISHPTPGVAKSHDDRHRGFLQFVEEHPDMNIVLDQAVDFSQTNATEEALAAHGLKIDGFCLTGGSATLPAAIIAAGLENDVVYTTIDIQGDVRTDLETGMCVGVAGGQAPTMQMAFIVIYNALATGEKVIVDRTKSLKRGYMWMYTPEDLDNYNAQMEGSIPAYTGDELKEMSLAHNPDATVETVWAQLQKYCAEYSLDEVMTRHADLLK